MRCVFLAMILILALGCGKAEKPGGRIQPKKTVPSPDKEARLRDSLNQAIEAAESILKFSPKDRDALLAAALSAEHLGLTDRAIQYYSRLQESTEETEYLGKLAELQQTSDPVVAARNAARFFEQGGENDRLRLWLIRSKTQKNQFLEAFRLTEHLPPPPDASAREFLRDLCLRVSQAYPTISPDALTALRRSSVFAPLPPNMVETAALTFLNAGDAAGARELLKTYAGSPAYILRAKIADRLEEPQTALEQRLKYFYSGGRDPKELLVLMEYLGRSHPSRQVAEFLWNDKSIDLRSRLAVANRLAFFYRQASDTAAEIRFLENAQTLGEPAFLERMADLQQAIGNARAALSALRSRYPQTIPGNKMDLYVTQALSAGENDEAFRVASRAPVSALSPNTRRRLAEIMNALAESDIASGQLALARNTALRAGTFWTDPHNHKILARISLAESDTPAAVGHLLSALKLSPADPQANYLTGKILFSQARFSEAKPHLQSAYAGRVSASASGVGRAPSAGVSDAGRVAPSPPADLPLMLGRIHYVEETFSMSYALLNEYAQSASNQVPSDVMEMLARSAVAAGRPADALDWFDRRLAIGDDEQLAAEFLSALMLAGKKARALGAVRSYIIKYPTSKPILQAASNIFDVSADSPAILRSLEALSAIETDPDKKFSAQRRLVELKLRMGRAGEADALLAVLLERFPDDPMLLSMAWNIRKGTPAADPILKRLATIRSPGDPIQIVRARQMMDIKDFGGASSVLKSYLAFRKDDPDAIALQAEIYAQMGNAELAAASNRALFKIRQDDAARRWIIRYAYDQALAALAGATPLPNAESLYAEAARFLGSEEKYMDLYEVFGKFFARDARTRALAIDAFQREFRLTQDEKKRARIAESLGQWYLADGQLLLAKEMYSASHLAGNTSSNFLRSFASLLARLGEHEEAAERYRLLLKQSPFDREANLYLAQRAAQQGHPEDAIRSMEALRSASPDDSGVLESLARAYAATRRQDKAAQAWGKLADQTGALRYTAHYADALFDAGNYQEALREYRKLMQSGAADAAQLRRLAELEQGQGNWAAAEEIVMRLLRMGGTDKDRKSLANVLRLLGDRAVQGGNAMDAARMAERLLAIDENDPAAFLLMGRAKLLEGRLPSAAESFSRARAIAPADPRPILGLAETELRGLRPVAAIDFAKKALLIDTALPEAYSLIGLAYQRQGNVRHAYAAFKHAILHSRNRSQAHVRMGDLFLQHGKYNVALEQYRQALAVDPKNAQAHHRNALALHKLGFSENAMKELIVAMDMDPAGVGMEARVLLSEMFAGHGNLDEARRILESAAAAPNAPPEALFRLGEIARRNGELAKSVRFFKDALAAGTDPAFRYDVMNALGLSLSSLNDLDGAEKILREAVMMDPRRPDALLNLSLLYRGKKNFPSAVDLARKAVIAAPGRPEGYKLLGLIYYEAGWEKESLFAFRESLRINPDQPEIVNFVRNIEPVEEE